MENKGCGCGNTEYIEESIKDNETKEDKGCECEDEKHMGKPEEKADNDCGREDNLELAEEDDACGCAAEYANEPKEDAGCGCGCGATEYVDVDASLIANPDKPKFVVDEKFINEFENYAHSMGIKSIGYTQITPELLITDKFIQYPHAIVLAMEMDKEIIETDPGPEANELNNLAYEKLGNITYKLSDYLRENGFATEVAHPFGNLINFSVLGQKAGIGYMGKSGLLITPELGPRQKISAIFVSIANLPVKDNNEHSWIPNYCDKCGKCVKACPEKALIEKEDLNGNKEAEFVQERCIGCSQGCTYCIEDCPFDKKGYEHVKNRFDKMSSKLMEKKN